MGADDEVVVTANAADIRLAVANALAHVGYTFDDLAEQARTGHFESIQSRLAWVAIGDLYQVDIEDIYGLDT